jgi:hypothetical protein
MVGNDRNTSADQQHRWNLCALRRAYLDGLPVYG